MATVTDKPYNYKIHRADGYKWVTPKPIPKSISHPSNCKKCGEEVFNKINGWHYVEKVVKYVSFSFRWVTYCAVCDLKTYSADFSEYDGEYEVVKLSIDNQDDWEPCL